MSSSDRFPLKQEGASQKHVLKAPGSLCLEELDLKQPIVRIGVRMYLHSEKVLVADLGGFSPILTRRKDWAPTCNS